MLESAILIASYIANRGGEMNRMRVGRQFSIIFPVFQSIDHRGFLLATPPLMILCS